MQLMKQCGYGTKVIVTPLPYLSSIGITNENALILDFNLNNLNDIVEQIKNVSRVSWSVPEDNYKKYLYKSKSKYKEMRRTMKRIKVKNKFLDMKHNNVLRRAGETFIEESERAKDLIERGFCILVEDLDAYVEDAKEEIEVAIKEVKKEKAVKEKAIKKNAKK